MTALDLPRLVFSGDFQADVSTVNNDVRHYDTDAFEQRFQQPRTGTSSDGWWNPSGSGAFRLVDCVVRRVAHRDGSTGPATGDPVSALHVTGAAARVSGKLVDLDPQWQMSSEIWGLGVRLADAAGSTVLEATFDPAPFRDIQFDRQSSPQPNGQSASAVYTSRLSAVRSALPPGGSRFLDELLDASEDGTLAIRLTTFGYFTNARHPRFTLGRVLGAIGPGRAGRPRRFVLGRRLAPANGSATAERVSFADAVVADADRRISLDLGNALPITDPYGTTADLGSLSLAVLRTPDGADGSPGVREGDRVPAADLVVLGAIDYRTPGWLSDTAGIVDVTVDDASGRLLADHPLAVVAPDGERFRVVLRETFGGLLARADDVVLRVDAASGPVPVPVSFYAARWGVPLPAATIGAALAGPMSGQGGGPPGDTAPPTSAIPDIGTPPAAVEVPAGTVTATGGRAELTLTVHDPGNPRGYLDGQVYVVGYGLVGQSAQQRHRLDVTVVHVRDTFVPPPRPTWIDDVRRVFLPYGNLYPIMSRRLVDLGNYDAVREHAGLLELAFSRPLDDPNHMPVTRDLSEGKRAMVLSWLRDRNSSGERRLVHGPRPAPTSVPTAVDTGRLGDGLRAAATDDSPAGEVGEIGGKSVAMPQTLDQLTRATAAQTGTGGR